MSTILLISLLGLFDVVLGLPCLTNDSKKDFDKTRSALKNLESYLSNTVSTLQGQVNTINSKVKQLDKDLITMEDDFKKRQWRKYNGHCYFFGTDFVNWVTAERRCREIGGILVKIDDASETKWLVNNIVRKGYYHWIGLTDVQEGDFRWTYDQSTLSYKNFKSGHPKTASSDGYKRNCVLFHPSNGLWNDNPCSGGAPYICESNFCF
ncbi:perlucin-like protein [Mytilus californianus]|uniref:perlucin-like protein n=1 Tax=Mytilus californianus TaxID=6549 RepID=UPI002246CB2C|nr:perlucin-like protein [Mytilus californianus]